MKKLLIGLLAFGSLSSYAGFGVDSSICDLLSEERSEKSISNLKATIMISTGNEYDTHDLQSGSQIDPDYIFRKVSEGKDLLESIKAFCID